MIKHLYTTQTMPMFGHATEFFAPEFTITPTLDGYWVQGPSRAAHFPRAICVPVFEGSALPIPEWVGAIAAEVPTGKGVKRGKENQAQTQGVLSP